MKRVWFEWTNVSVPQNGRWELQLDQVLDCEDVKAVYAIVELSGTATGDGFNTRLYTTPDPIVDSVGSGRGGWQIAASNAALTGPLYVNVVLAALPQNSGSPNYPPMGAMTLALESYSIGTPGTFQGNVRACVCMKDRG